jgi:hypothetical protein
MIINKASIIIGDKNSHYSVINKAVGIIKDTFNDGFSINDLTSLDSFSSEEKECLRDMFSTNISTLYAWEYNFQFYFHDNLWHYDESGYQYRRTMRFILLLLNTSTTSIGEKVRSTDYLLIENLYHSWNKFYDEEIKRMMQTSRMYEIKSDTIQFISRSLRTRVGDSCEFNYEFVRAFAESMEDYYQKLLYEAIMGHPQSDGS